MSLLTELKRRNVFRVAALYLAFGWLTLQATDVTSSLLGLPGWVGKVMVALLLAGFPVALVISWLFEFTPDGLVRDTPGAIDTQQRQKRARRMDVLVVLAASLILILFVVDRLWPVRTALPTSPAVAADPGAAMQGQEVTAIAILPFTNLSPDPEQEFLADGITEDILGLLANVPGLRVTSRTSVFTFKGQDYDLPTIGRKLGVNLIVEGSVRRSGQRIRITAQAIDVARDVHIWSETYDRELDDVFAIQSDVASQIARILNTAMSTDELSLIGTPPTTNLAAWQSFLAARVAWRARTSNASIGKSLTQVDDAIAADPGFARARSLRAVLLLQSATSGAELEAAVAEAQLALEQAPDLGEPRFVLAQVAVLNGRLEEADAQFRAAIRQAPNNADGRVEYARFLLAAGYLGRAWAEAQRAVELDPLSPSVFWGAAFVALTAGNLEAVAEFTARSRENGWTGWQPDAIEGGAALLAGELDKAEAHFNAAMPHLSTRVSAVFSAMRSGEVDPAARAALDAMGTYGPPGAARWSTEVLIGDLDAAFETAWQDLRVVAPQLARQHGGPGNAERLELAPPIRGDWWFGDVRAFRQDPRFVELMTAVGLMDFWRVNGWPDLCAPEGDGLRCR